MLPGRTDAAVYRAKERGRARYELFDHVMRVRAVERLRMENELRRAIEGGQLRVWYQPLVHLDDQRIHSLEALVRWEHPVRGVVLPEEFIPVAEETGLIAPLGSWVLEQVCRQIAAWRDASQDGLAPTVAVNLSARQLARSDFEDVVKRALAHVGLDPACLSLEITSPSTTSAPDTRRSRT